MPKPASIKDIKNVTRVPSVIVDQEGLVTYVNRDFEEAFGWTSDEIIGEFITRIIPGNMHDAHNLAFSRFIITGQSSILNQTLTLAAVNKAGKEFVAEHRIIAEQKDGRWLFGATIKPVNPDGS